jgi:NAD(P)-dependent dehydrogenase (short-subunit alcohol dehydrogenase family)
VGGGTAAAHGRRERRPRRHEGEREDGTGEQAEGLHDGAFYAVARRPRHPGGGVGRYDGAMTNPTEKVALVTGGSRGIGRAIVESLLGRGHRVFFCGRDPRGLQDTLEKLFIAHPGKVAARTCDVRQESAVRDLVAWVDQEAGRLDVLVNNAGLGRFAPIDELEPEEFREVIETNLCGPFYAVHFAAPVMMRGGGGWIFNIASLAAKNAFAGGAAYNASKFGLLGMSEAAMLDLRHQGIRIAAICPGSVATELRTTMRNEPQEWMLRPEDVAKVVTDLLDFPDRALPSRIEIRPTRPPKQG